MDCPSEESLIRIKLSQLDSVKSMEFDLKNRALTVYHKGETDQLSTAIESLNLQGKLVSTQKTNEFQPQNHTDQKRLLWVVLAINFSFFLIEITTGFISKSMGLVADSLDMLADAFVYAISLLAVGRSAIRKKKVAKIAGYFQLTLAVLGFSEVVRRFISGIELPDFRIMIIVSIFALVANALCLILLNRSSSKNEAHMKASLIFTSNDVIINLGVIISGALVLWTQSGIPDLLIGSIVFLVVVQGARRILALGR